MKSNLRVSSIIKFKYGNQYQWKSKKLRQPLSCCIDIKVAVNEEQLKWKQIPKYGTISLNQRRRPKIDSFFPFVIFLRFRRRRTFHFVVKLWEPFPFHSIKQTPAPLKSVPNSPWKKSRSGRTPNAVTVRKKRPHNNLISPCSTRF